MVPLYYGGIDRVYGDISQEGADKILDLIDEYIYLKEATEMKTTDATEEECKSVDDYVKSISHEVDFNYEEFVMFLKAIMTDYDFENFVTLYRDFKENGGELNGWFFDKEE